MRQWQQHQQAMNPEPRPHTIKRKWTRMRAHAHVISEEKRTLEVVHKLRKSHTHRHIRRVLFIFICFESLMCACMCISKEFVGFFFGGCCYVRVCVCVFDSYKKNKGMKKKIWRQNVLVYVFCMWFRVSVNVCACACSVQLSFCLSITHRIRCCHFTALLFCSVKRRLSNHFARFHIFLSTSLARSFAFSCAGVAFYSFAFKWFLSVLILK